MVHINNDRHKMKKKGTIYIREFFSQAKLMFLLILTGGAGEVGAEFKAGLLNSGTLAANANEYEYMKTVIGYCY